MAIIKEWTCWFIQNQHSTYIRVSGFIGSPTLLPIYYNDRIILLEYVMQMLGLQSLLSSKHKTGVDFSILIGYFSCSKIQVAKSTKKELQDLHLREFNYAWECYDPYGKLKQIMPKEYDGHRPRFEDFLANLQESFEVREKNNSRLSMPQTRNFKIETNLPKELRDDGELLDPTYKEKEIDKKPLSPIRWSG